MLLLHANEVVSVDRIVEDVWGESPPPTAAKIVRNYISLLRKELGDRLVTRPPGYLLRVEDGELDSERLEHAVRSSDLESLNAALALWRGPPLSQFAYDGFAQEEIARLEELRLVAVEARIDAELALGRHAGVISELEALVQRHPLREPLRGQLMLALYRSGRQADALDAYQRARRSLDEQLGIEPGPALRELERGILNQDEALAAPPAATPTLPRGRRRLVVLAGAVCLLATLVAAVAVLGTRDSADAAIEVPPNYVGVIDPATNEVVDVIPVGIRPGSVAAGAGSVWVANVDDRNLTRIDPRQRSAVAAISLDNRTPTGLAVGPGAVWVAHGRSGELSRVEPQFGQLTNTVVVTERSYASPNGSVAVGAGYVWVVYGDSTLARIDRAAVRSRGTTLTGANPASVVVGGGAVWVANAGDATVQRFDPSTFEEGPLRSVSVGKRPAALAFGEGALWVANQGDASVTRIDPSTHSTSTIRVGDQPSAVVVGAGAVWVANAGDGTISRVDPATGEVERTIVTGNAPAGVAVADGVVWVTVQAS